MEFPLWHRGTIPLVSMRIQVLSLALLSGLGIWHCRELWCRSQMPTLLWLWLWCRLAAVTLIVPLAWEIPYAEGTALRSKKKKKELLIFYLLIQKSTRLVICYKYFSMFLFDFWFYSCSFCPAENANFYWDKFIKFSFVGLAFYVVVIKFFFLT